MADMLLTTIEESGMEPPGIRYVFSIPENRWEKENENE